MDNAEGATITTVTVKMDDVYRKIDPEITNATTFQGNVEVFTTSSEAVLVKLQAYYEDGFDDCRAEFNPEIMFFEQNSKKRFDVRFIISDYTRARDYEILIGGYYQFEGSESWKELDKLKIYLGVTQYYSISFLPTDEMVPYIKTDLNDDIHYRFLLSNNGNGKDSLSIDLLNRNDLHGKDWQIEYKPSLFDLTAFTSIELDVSITPPINYIPEETIFQFQLGSSGDSSVIQNLGLYLYRENDGFVLATGPRPLIILRPLELPIKQLHTGQTIEMEVEARCYIDEASIYLEPILYGQELTGADSKFETDLRATFIERGIDINIEPRLMNLEPGESGIFTLKVKGNNETTTQKRFAELLVLEVEGDNTIGNTISYEFVFITREKQDSTIFMELNAMEIVAISSFSILGLALAIAGSTEFGRYQFLLLFIPLYTKLHKEKVLDHFTRGRIYEYLRSHPGAHFSELKRELRLTNGGLAYHLYTLEREELVRSYRAGKLKLFYTREFGIPKDEGRQFSELEAIILEIIDENPGISQREVGELILNRNHRTVSHNIKQLSREGYIRLEKEGRSNQCYIDFSSLGKSEDDKKKESELQKFSMTYRM